MTNSEQHLYQIGCSYAPSRRVMIVNVYAPTKRQAIAAAKRVVDAETGWPVDRFVELAGAATPHLTVTAQEGDE